MILDWTKSAVVVFLAAILQVSVFSDVTILNGTPDLLLVTIVASRCCVARSSARSPGFGRPAGRHRAPRRAWMTSLLLTVAGYWIGRYGETTGQRRCPRALVSAAAITLLYAVGSLGLPLRARRPGARARRAVEHPLPDDRR